MGDSLYLNGVTVNSEANARRIGLVEGCFGSAGQPLAVPGQIISYLQCSGTVSVILSANPCKEAEARFTMVP